LKRFKLVLLFSLFTIVMSCAYYNTFYNAQMYYELGIKDYRESLTKTNQTYSKKNFDFAIEKSKRVLAKYPDSKYVDDAQFLIAVCNYYKNNFRKAKKEIELFFATYPESELKTEMDMWYGRVFWKMGNPEMAIHHWQQMAPDVEDNELKAEMYYSIAETYEEIDKPDSAIFYYDKTTKVRGGSEKHGIAQYNIAEIYLKLGDMDKAIDNIEKVGQFNITTELKQKRQILLLKTYRQAGQYKKAEKTIYKKLNDEKNKDIWDQLELELALIFKDQGDTASAMSRFKTIIDTKEYKKTKSAASSYYYMGMMNLMEFHKYDVAAKNFGLVKSENKDCEFVYDAEQRVKQLKRFETISASLVQTTPLVNQVLTGLNSPEEVEIDTVVVDTVLKSQEEVKQELEEEAAVAETKPAQIDTLKTFEDFYNARYELSELYYFDFNFQDSAKYYLRDIAASQYFNPFVEQSLYALYYISELEEDKGMSDFYKETLAERNPDSPYISFIETSEIVIPDFYENEKVIFEEAEVFIKTNPDSAIILFEQLASYENPYQGKSTANIAWLMENEKFDLENSILWYQTVVDSFPDDETAKLAKDKVKMLNELAASLDKPEEEPAPKNPDVESDSLQTAIPDSLVVPPVENQPTTSDSTENKVEKVEAEKVNPDTKNNKELEEELKKRKAAMENEAMDDPIKNKGTVKKNEKDLPVKNIEK